MAAVHFGAACKRASRVHVDEPPERLSAPNPSSSLVSTPLDGLTTGYTNEMQAELLRKETEEMGGSPKTVSHPLSKQEIDVKRQRLRELTRELARMRQRMEAANDKSVVLPGRTVDLIPRREKSGESMDAPPPAP
ncbi:MAG: hypothetical protein AAB036_12040 [Elusimicrobiota bacterium]